MPYKTNIITTRSSPTIKNTVPFAFFCWWVAFPASGRSAFCCQGSGRQCERRRSHHSRWRLPFSVLNIWAMTAWAILSKRNAVFDAAFCIQSFPAWVWWSIEMYMKIAGHLTESPTFPMANFKSVILKLFLIVLKLRLFLDYKWVYPGFFCTGRSGAEVLAL